MTCYCVRVMPDRLRDVGPWYVPNLNECARCGCQRVFVWGAEKTEEEVDVPQTPFVSVAVTVSHRFPQTAYRV